MSDVLNFDYPLWAVGERKDSLSAAAGDPLNFSIAFISAQRGNRTFALMFTDKALAQEFVAWRKIADPAVLAVENDEAFWTLIDMLERMGFQEVDFDFKRGDPEYRSATILQIRNCLRIRGVREPVGCK